jgi:xylulokinase
LTIEHGRPPFLRAVLEGVAYSLRDCTSLLAWLGVTEVRLCGGGATSGTWSRVIADVLALPLQQMQVLDASAPGAAIVAQAGCAGTDLFHSAQHAGAREVHMEPDGHNHELYSVRFRQYREIAGQYLRTFEAP